MKSGKLELFLSGAFGLKNTDFFGKSDPYAVISYQNQFVRSVTAKNEGSRPVWNQKFEFTVNEGVTELYVKIYDEDTWTADDFIGSAKIPLEEVFERGSVPATGYGVVLPSGKIKGLVKLALQFTPNNVTGHAVHSSGSTVGSVSHSISGD